VHVIGIDPGAITGYALLRETGEPVLTGAVAVDRTLPLELLLESWPDAHLVIETAPDSRHYQTPYIKIKSLVEATGRDIAFVRPSQWKGHPACRVPEKFETKHEGEAVGIGRWFLSQRRNNESDARRTHPQRP
jgi:hypothetical protein